MKKFVIALAITATAGLASAAPHQGYDHDRANNGAHMEKFAQKLGLSDAQKQQIRDIKTANRQKNEPLYADFRSKREELKQLKQANDPRADEVKTQLKALHQQLRDAKKAEHEQILNVLTADQRAKLEQWRKERQ